MTVLPLLSILISCGPKKAGSAGSSDFFPVAEGASWTYRGTFRGSTADETSISLPIEVGGEPAWVFIDQEDIDGSVAGTFTEMIGLGAYRLTDDGVLTADLSWMSEVGDLSSSAFQPMLSLPPLVGASVTPDTRSPDRSGGWTVEAFESITVPAGTFEGCARLGLGGESKAWLCPGVGLVRWIFVTGRVEELVAWEIPGVSSGP